MADSAEDIRWMRSALSLSKRGLGQVWPNPSVGCIIVKDGVVLGRGVTAAGGRHMPKRRRCCKPAQRQKLRQPMSPWSLVLDRGAIILVSTN